MKLLTATEINMTFFAGKESYQTILGMARSKQIPACRIGKRIFFDSETLEKFFLEKMANSVKNERETDQKGIRRID